MSEYDREPIPGLPGIPPPGEQILWQGRPDWRVLAQCAFHSRLVAGYFALLVGWATVAATSRGVHQASDLTGVVMTIMLGVIAVGLLHLLAWGSARTTIYTLTNRRIVLRVGMAVPKCINLPLGMIGSVDLAARADGTGDLPLTLIGEPKLGYLALWPHAQPWQIVRPRPMLRAVPEAATIAAMIARNCLAANPDGRISLVESATTSVESFGEVAAA